MQAQLGKAIEILRNGGLVAYPTDTVYGLGAHCLDAHAVLRVFEVKRRSLTAPLPLLVADLSMLRATVADFPEVAAALVERFLPGPLTLVLPKAPTIPDIVTAGSKTVAIRIPDHPVPVGLAAGIGAPLVGTSANRSGRPSPTTAAEVFDQLGESVDLLVEGVCRGGIESTVVDLSQGPPKIVRQGGVPAEAIEEVLIRYREKTVADGSVTLPKASKS